MDISIEKLSESDLPNLFEFECQNKDFFEKMVPGRPEEYFVYKSFQVIMEGLLNEQDDGLSRFYLIKNRQGVIVGRINLIDIDWARQSGNIGYRVGERYLGNGIATRALNMLLEEVQREGLKEIFGKTTMNNKASQLVLERNNFKQTSFEKDAIKMDGNMLDFIFYIWRSTKK